MLVLGSAAALGEGVGRATPLDSSDRSGRVIIVIGGSTGLGLMIARQAIDQGARVVIAGRCEANLPALRGEELRGKIPESLNPIIPSATGPKVI